MSAQNKIQVPTVTLNNGVEMPVFGLGTWKSSDEDARTALRAALEAGYTHIDGAAVYGNEAVLGEELKALLEEGVIKREELFWTSKNWNTDRHDVRAALEKTLKDLQLDYVDLYLIHWPQAFVKREGEVFPTDEDGKVVMDPEPLTIAEVWKQMEACLEAGLTRAIGVSNFNAASIEKLVETATVVPAVNQVECHPLLPQTDLLDVGHGIKLTAYSPLGSPGGSAGLNLLKDETIVGLAEKYGKSAANILCRWAIQRGSIVIPKSVTPSRIVENMAVFDFELTEEEMASVDKLGEKGPARAVDPSWFDFDKVYE